MLAVADKNKDGRIPVEGIEALLRNIGASDRMSRAEIETILSEEGESHAKVIERGKGSISKRKLFDSYSPVPRKPNLSSVFSSLHPFFYIFHPRFANRPPYGSNLKGQTWGLKQ
jgi:hypothetical protein